MSHMSLYDKCFEIIKCVVIIYWKRKKSGRTKQDTKLSIQLIKEKNFLMVQINSTFLPDQQIALEKLA